MKLACFTLLRNETPILRPFLDQLDEFFDDCVLVDHQSNDGSLAAIDERDRPDWRVFRLESPGYPQAEIATYFLGDIMWRTDADWLFFLDCDEFLPFPDRSALERRLDAASPDCELMEIKWRNLLPAALDGSNIFAGRFSSRSQCATFGKVAVSRGLFERQPEMKVLQGYHAVEVAGLNAPRRETLSDVGLLHLPVQSKHRFAAKIHMSGRLMIENAALYASNRGRHWANLYLDLENRGLDGFDFERAALDYPAMLPSATDERVDLDFGFDYVTSAYVERPDETIMQLFRTRSGTARSTALFDSDDRRVDAFDAGSIGAQGSAASPAAVSAKDGIDEFIATFDDTYTDVRLGEPRKLSALISLVIGVQRPRTVVSLGGGSTVAALAAALSADRMLLPMRSYEVVAPSLGTDEQNEASMVAFAVETARHLTSIEFIRAEPADVAAQFEPHSVDLIVVDAMASTEPETLAPWRDRLTSGGIVVDNGRGSGKPLEARTTGFWSDFVSVQFEAAGGTLVALADPAAVPALQALVDTPELLRRLNSEMSARWAHFSTNRALGITMGGPR